MAFAREFRNLHPDLPAAFIERRSAAEKPLRGRLRIAGIVVERVVVDHVGIVRVTARGVERRRIEEQIVKFSRRRRPLLADHLGDVENLWRDREKTEPRRQEPSVVVRERCDTIDKIVGSCAAPLGVLDRSSR